MVWPIMVWPTREEGSLGARPWYGPTAGKSMHCESLLPSSLLHFHSLPECDIPLDLPGRRLRIRVIPRRIRVFLALHLDIVITGRPFPRAHGVGRTSFEMFRLDRIGRKILVALNFHALIGLREYRAFPDCFCHDTSLDFPYAHGLRKISSRGRGFDPCRVPF